MQKDKVNAELGKKVHEHLVKKGVEIPMEEQFDGSHKEKIEEMQKACIPMQ